MSNKEIDELIKNKKNGSWTIPKDRDRLLELLENFYNNYKDYEVEKV